MIEVRELRKSFGRVQAVDGVTFHIPGGICFGLLGPNGAGKTTTIRMLMGLLEPDGGRLRVAGGDPGRAEVRRSLGLAPQETALYDELTARENLAFFGRVQGLSGSRLKERVTAALELAGLEDRAGDRVGTFSGGMKRRLNLAVAALHEPRILFLDEPTQGVDPQSRNRIFQTIQALKEQGTTILYTTHYMEEAERLCDRIAIMDRGKILAEGTVEEILEKHGGESLVRVEEAGAPPREIRTRDPLAEILRLAREGKEILALHVERADLETVFLELTGRRLRDQ